MITLLAWNVGSDTQIHFLRILNKKERASNQDYEILLKKSFLKNEEYDTHICNISVLLMRLLGILDKS